MGAVHERLGRVARRRGSACVALAVVVAAAGPAAVGLAAGGPATAAWSAALAVLVATGVLVVDPDRGARAAEPRHGTRPAGGALAGLAAALAGAGGQRAPVVELADHPAPNVGALRHRMIVTTGAVERLSRDQLEAVCAAQVALAADRGTRRLLRAGATLSALRWGALGGLCASTVLVPRPVLAVGVMAVFASVGAAALLCTGPVSWWAGVAADAVCIRTTRHPEALAGALVELAAWNGLQVPVRGRLRTLWSPVDAWWAVPVGLRWEANTAADGRAVRRRTSEQESDVRLLLRAAAVRRLGTGEPATLAGYRRVAGTLRRAATDAAAGRATEVDGTSVALDGARRRRAGRDGSP